MGEGLQIVCDDPYVFHAVLCVCHGFEDLVEVRVILVLLEVCDLALCQFEVGPYVGEWVVDLVYYVCGQAFE